MNLVFYFEIAVAIVATLALTIYTYLVWNFGYWTKRGIKGPKPKALTGTFPNSLNQKRNMIYDMKDIYDKYKKTDKFVGIFTIRQPELMILDPALAHDIYVSKFKYFHDNASTLWVDKNHDEIMGNNPFFLTGNEWKEKRAEITPALTASRIKACYPLMQQVCNRMSHYIKNKLLNSPKKLVLNTKDLSNRFTAEVVSDCIFGFDAGCFSGEESQILIEAKKMMENFISTFQILMITNLIPIIKKFYKVKIFSEASETFFKGLLDYAVELRLKTKSDRADFLNYLLQLKEKKNLTKAQMTTHSLTFFADGYETSAALIAHCLMLLARNKRVQDKLRAVIESNLNEDGSISFENLLEMEYLDNCLHETLRLFAPVPFLSKLCTEAIDLENYDRKSYKIDVGTTVHMPVHLYHNDSDFYENAEDFIPERFNNENGGVKKYRDEGKFIAFGDGPRSCLGQKFGLAQSKAAICEIVKNFELTLNEKTRTDNLLDPKSFFSILDGGLWVNFTEIKNK